MFLVMPDDDRFGNEVCGDGKRGGTYEGTEQQVSADIKDVHPTAPMEIFPMMFGNALRPLMRLAEDEIADVVLEPVNEGHQGQDDIVQGRGEDRSKDVTACQPGKEDRQQGLEAEQRGQSEKDPDGYAAGDGLRCVTNRKQLQ